MLIIAAIFEASWWEHDLINWETTIDFVEAILLKNLIYYYIGSFIRSFLVRALIRCESEIFPFILA
jgi:hypothetical protein